MNEFMDAQGGSTEEELERAARAAGIDRGDVPPLPAVDVVAVETEPTQEAAKSLPRPPQTP